MAKDLKAGDPVVWNNQGGKVRGTVVKKLTAPTHIKSHKVAASESDPQYLVETEKGKRAAHKPGALTKGKA